MQKEKGGDKNGRGCDGKRGGKSIPWLGKLIDSIQLLGGA